MVGKEQAEEEEEKLGETDHDAKEAPGQEHGHDVVFKGSADNRDATPDMDPLVHRCRLRGSSCLTTTVWVTGEKEKRCNLFEEDGDR